MTRVVHVPYTVERDEEGVWCAHAQLRPGVGANADGETREAAIADLREALTALITEFGSPEELTVTLEVAWCRRCRAFAGDQVVKALEKVGFLVVRIRGSHHVLRHPDGRGTTVPVHQGRDPAKGTLRNVLIIIVGRSCALSAH